MKGMTPELKEQLFPKNTILLGYRGSIAHNMYVPNVDPNSIDDIDIMGIYMAPEDHYIGIEKAKEVYNKFIDKWDVVNYEFLKFINLLIKSNPNVLSLLWLKKNHYIEITPVGQRLIESRDLFVSKKIYHSFTGYAYSQLKRMTNYTFEGYMGEKRKALVDKYGYDCKNAAHCIRLLKMGMEFLIEGKLNVFREDAPWLLSIKRGEWKLEDVKEEAKRLFSLADEAYVRSSLPPEPDYEKANRLVKEIIFDHLKNERYAI
jgi:predicted nucleotidyltransferase